MMNIPHPPAWEALHPLVIHFPIVLLLVSPVFVFISALLSPLKGRAYLFAGLALLLAGTGSLYLAAETGEAAAELADRTPEMNGVLQAHEQLASLTRLLFSGLSVLLVTLIAVAQFTRRQSARVFSTVLPLAFLALYLTGVFALVNTAHQGGRLVHQFGIHAMVAP